MPDNESVMTALATTSTTTAPVLPPLHIGRHVIESPVVLAPMAGITNRAFRRICRDATTWIGRRRRFCSSTVVSTFW